MYLSVVTSVYNGAEFLSEAIESVLNQTYHRFEFILVDDGSTDESLEIIQSYARKDPRIRVLTPGRLGLCDALNAGIEAARYDWIVRLDADDVCLPTRFARQVEAIEQMPHAAVIGSFVNHINRDGKVLSEWNFGPASIEEYDEWMRDGVIPQVIHSSAVLNRKYVDQIGGYDPAMYGSEDYDIFDRLSDYGPIVAVPETLVHYRVHGSSITATRYLEQQTLSKYILARRHAQNEGRTLDYATFMADRRRLSLLQRVRDKMSYLRGFYYRRGAVAYAEKNYLQLAWYLGMALLLNPMAVLSRIWQQFFAPRIAWMFGDKPAPQPEAVRVQATIAPKVPADPTPHSREQIMG